MTFKEDFNKYNYLNLHINISPNDINKKITLICAILRHSQCKIEELNLSCKGLNSANIKSITKVLKNNKTVKKLYLSENNICSEGALAIADVLKTNNTLEQLDLSENNICSNGAKAIFEALHDNKSLKILDLARNEIKRFEINTGETMSIISNCLKSKDCPLVELDLWGNDLDDDDIKDLANALKENEKLEELELSLNEFSSSGLQYLSDALKINKLLKSIGLNGLDLDDKDRLIFLEMIDTSKLNCNDNISYVDFGFILPIRRNETNTTSM